MNRKGIQCIQCQRFQKAKKQLCKTIAGGKEMYMVKGQIISKGLFGVVSSNSPKKQTNEFIVVVKTNLFVRFLGEFEGTKSPFEII